METVTLGIESNVHDTSSEQRSPKRRKVSHHDASPCLSGRPEDGDCLNSCKWSTEAERRIYSTKLVEALRRSRRPSSAVGYMQVREMADRVLAAAARGTTRWSRAILTGRSMRMRLRRFRKVKKATGEPRPRRKEVNRRLPPVEKRLRVLGRLVPGCRKVKSFSSLLDETTDYISALQMQVKAMATLAEILAGAGRNSPPETAADDDNRNHNDSS